MSMSLELFAIRLFKEYGSMARRSVVIIVLIDNNVPIGIYFLGKWFILCRRDYWTDIQNFLFTFRSKKYFYKFCFTHKTYKTLYHSKEKMALPSNITYEPQAISNPGNKIKIKSYCFKEKKNKDNRGNNNKNKVGNQRVLIDNDSGQSWRYGSFRRRDAFWI